MKCFASDLSTDATGKSVCKVTASHSSTFLLKHFWHNNLQYITSNQSTSQFPCSPAKQPIPINKLCIEIVEQTYFLLKILNKPFFSFFGVPSDDFVSRLPFNDSALLVSSTLADFLCISGLFPFISCGV